MNCADDRSNRSHFDPVAVFVYSVASLLRYRLIQTLAQTIHVELVGIDTEYQHIPSWILPLH